MPIRPENKGRYPTNWPAISKQVRREAGNRCEWCKAPNGKTIFRGQGSDAGTYMISDGQVFSELDGSLNGCTESPHLYDGKPVKIVLTVAHLDHIPENCDRSNLRALCQQCHNRYDAPVRAMNRKKRNESAQHKLEIQGE